MWDFPASDDIGMAGADAIYTRVQPEVLSVIPPFSRVVSLKLIDRLNQKSSSLYTS